MLEVTGDPLRSVPGAGAVWPILGLSVTCTQAQDALRMRDFGIGLSDEPHRVAWRLDLRGAVAAVYKPAAYFWRAIQDFDMIQSSRPQDRGDRRGALQPGCGLSWSMILEVTNGVLPASPLSQARGRHLTCKIHYFAEHYNQMSV